MGKVTRRMVVLAALCAGLLAALLAYLFLEREKVQAARATEPVQVVVATQDIPTRTVIEPGMVREATRPVVTLPTNPATSTSEVIGRVTVTSLAAEQPVQREAVAAPSASLGLAYIVPEGMRAVTVAIDQIIGVAGFLKAGDHVDVLATFEVDELGVTKTVLQDVELLAIGPEIVPEDQNRPASAKEGRPKEQPNATLALVPGDAEKLILAGSQGKLMLTLRAKGDNQQVALVGVRSDSLTGLSPWSRSAAAAPRPAARVLPAGYTSPAFFGTAPQPVTFNERVKISKDELDKLVTVETVRGTKASTVEVMPE